MSTPQTPGEARFAKALLDEGLTTFDRAAADVMASPPDNGSVNAIRRGRAPASRAAAGETPRVARFWLRLEFAARFGAAERPAPQRARGTRAASVTMSSATAHTSGILDRAAAPKGGFECR